MKQTDKLSYYFKKEKKPLAIITCSGILYNMGMAAGPFFEGQLVQRLFDIVNGKKTLRDMVILAGIYLFVILFVQGSRCIKRFYVRRFANDTNLNMRHVIYNNLVHKSKKELAEASLGGMMTKAITDVDTCSEGMRKVTTEIFDTGVVLVAYLVMLFYYDWRLTLISCCFIPIVYVLAEFIKKVVYRYNLAYKKSAGRLNDATMDRITAAITYRVFGQEEKRNQAYEEQLRDYEKKAVWANVWENTVQPLYHMISMTGVVFIICFGAANLNGTGWVSWNIAAFMTFLSCFSKMALKSSKAAKLLNAVQKAKVSWVRIKPLMQTPIEEEENNDLSCQKEAVILEVEHVSFSYEKGDEIIHDLSFRAKEGQIIGVTGPVASGKSTLGKLFLCEEEYQGSIQINNIELSKVSEAQRSQLVSYQGHQPELISDSIRENITLGEKAAIDAVLKLADLTQEVAQMTAGADTDIGNGGESLSGGQKARLALARTCYHSGKVLILDDPFSAVDYETERKIMEELRVFARDKIILLISHRLSCFSTFDQVIWVENGAAKVGTHEIFCKENEAYRNLVYAQQRGGDRNEA